MIYTQGLHTIRAAHVAMAGGKGAALGELLGVGVPVPPGFVVTTTAFRHFLQANKLPHPTAAAIMAAGIPPALQTEITAEYKKLGSPFVAVRSSATAEDSAAHAWAGQLESFVPTSAATLLTNIKKCWASLYSPRAIAYRAQAGLADAEVSVAVVVQQLIESERSGIAFSVHPVTGNADHIVVEAVHGLGEAAVGGHVTPDTYVLAKAGGDIIEMYNGAQDKQLVRGAGGEAVWQPLPAYAQKLSPAALQQLAAHVRRIEQHFGRPTDIEWAHKRDTFYIVQSRPITTL